MHHELIACIYEEDRDGCAEVDRCLRQSGQQIFSCRSMRLR